MNAIKIMGRAVLLPLCLCLVFSGLIGCKSKESGEGSATDQSAAEQSAVVAAEAWLKLIDEGKFGQSHDQAAGIFKKAIKRAEWEQRVKPALEPFGKLTSRSVKSKKYATSLPGAPDGEYVVIEFTSSFENKKDAVETVTPMKDADGTWKVSGYYIK